MNAVEDLRQAIVVDREIMSGAPGFCVYAVWVRCVPDPDRVNAELWQFKVVPGGRYSVADWPRRISANNS